MYRNHIKYRYCRKRQEKKGSNAAVWVYITFQFVSRLYKKANLLISSDFPHLPSTIRMGKRPDQIAKGLPSVPFFFPRLETPLCHTIATPDPALAHVLSIFWLRKLEQIKKKKKNPGKEMNTKKWVTQTLVRHNGWYFTVNVCRSFGLKAGI